jgi:hypothetical protein
MDSPQRRSVLGAMASAALGLAAPGAFAAGAAVEKISGEFGDGTHWAVSKPAKWNGTLLLDLDGAGFPAPPPGRTPPPLPAGIGAAMLSAPPTAFQDWLLSQGFAVGGTMREPIGYQFDKALDNLIEVRRLFAAKWAPPKRTLALGTSRGAFVARLALERHPEIFKGGMVNAGGGGGEIAGLHDRLNTTFALKTLVDPSSPARLVNIDDVHAEETALGVLLAKAVATPPGRARLALAAAFEQYAPWTSRDKPKPAPDDYDAVVDQIAETFAFANPPSVRAGVEKIAGGNVSWNTHDDYTDLLRRSGRQAMVEALYRKAGLDLGGDLATLKAAPRISADKAAVAKAERLMTYTGRLGGPLIEVDNDDPIDPAPYKLAYRQTLRRAETEKLFRLLWVDAAGHAAQTPLDRAVGLKLLVHRLDAGAWGDTSLPALKALAAQIARASPIALGQPTFFDPGPIPAPLFTWDSGNWGTYRGG